jgi:hypothetical protein
MNTTQCFGYAAECPLQINHYYDRDQNKKCEIAKVCYTSWKASGGRLGLEGIIKYGEKP